MIQPSLEQKNEMRRKRDFACWVRFKASGKHDEILKAYYAKPAKIVVFKKLFESEFFHWFLGAFLAFNFVIFFDVFTRLTCK